MKFQKEGRLTNVKLLVPNLEFRISQENKHGKAVQYHVIIDPEINEDIDRAKRELQLLTFGGVEREYQCCADDLAALGRAHVEPKNNGETEEGYRRRCMREGANQFKPSASDFREWLTKRAHWLRQHSIVVLARGGDGAEFPPQGGWREVSNVSRRFADAVFSGQPSDREYWLGMKPGTEQDIALVGLPKPCVHGSDAHSLARVLKPAKERKCWIKAEATFDGLRQILLEPEERVHIGPVAPPVHDPGKIIAALRVNSDASAFPAEPIPLSPYLTVIIGQRGSASRRSQISSRAPRVLTANLIAKRTTLRASSVALFRCLKARHFTLSGSTGVPTRTPVATRPGFLPRARYLPQKFVESLCSSDLHGDLLVRQIEDVIYQHTAEAEREGTTSFQELLSRRTAALDEELSSARRDLEGGIEQYCEYVEKLKKVDDSEKAAREARAELDRLRERLKAGLEEQQETGDGKKLEELSNLEEQLRECEAAIGSLLGLGSDAARLAQRIANEERHIATFNAEVSEELRRLGVPPADRPAFTLGFQGQPRLVLDRFSSELAARREKREQAAATISSPEGSRTLSKADVEAEIAALTASLAMDRERSNQLAKLRDDAAKQQQRTELLEEAVKQLDHLREATVPSKKWEYWSTLGEWYDRF